ncbi:MAG TPA: flagellar M-ring protein FliF C-terminal domain-containing protein [Candidatus Megaira endosymbiont of Hartmannula sinica]|nr:flagellar M-ring protein FliF C-terminal domain-containing protein [Candidatus Megaera endosymbiont of Hartmannula sinica]
MVTSTEYYDPDNTALRSSRQIEESQRIPSGSNRSNVSVANNIPSQSSSSNKDGDKFAVIEKSDQVNNYEISKTVKNHISQYGSIEKMSIAVMIDGYYDKNNDTGAITYRARDKDELNKITDLIKAATGFNKARGDNIEVLNMPFNNEKYLDDNIQENINADQALTSNLKILVAVIIILTVVALLSKLYLSNYLNNKRSSQKSHLSEISPLMQNNILSNNKNSTITDENSLTKDEINSLKSENENYINNISESKPEDILNIIRKWMYQGPNSK